METRHTVEELLGGHPVETISGIAHVDRLSVVDYPFGSPATSALYRAHGHDADGVARSLFVKVLQHVRHWPGLAMMPPGLAAEFHTLYPWRSELEAWDDWWLATLPDGVRVPRLHAVVDLPDDRAAVWMEDVAVRDVVWDLDRYERAAHLLGRWNARCTAPEVLARSPYGDGYALRMYAERAVPMRGLGPLQSDELWGHPWIAPHADLRADLRALGADIPAMLDRLDTHPQCLPHGDASPQNLLVPTDDDAELVAIDVSFRTPHALGFDLGQLLVGLVHAAEVRAERLPAIAARLVPAYLAGCAAEDVDADEAGVRDAFATSALLRSGFDALPLETFGSPDPDGALADACAERVALSRFLVEQYQSR